VPELAKLPNKYMHAPWEAPPATLASAGVVLGQTYPERITCEDMQVCATAAIVSSRMALIPRSRSPAIPIVG
jgi:deoxyribodipyrimidine photolyase